MAHVAEEISQQYTRLLAKAGELVHANNKILQKPLSECFENPLSNRLAAEELQTSGILEKLAEVNLALESIEKQYPELKNNSLARNFYHGGEPP
jgi:hypothetical protein